MELSNRTLNILKNFASINQGIVIEPTEEGTKQEISTVTQGGNKLVAFANIDETFPVQVAFYNLNKFLAAYTKSKDAVKLDLKEDMAVIKYGSNSVARLRYSDIENIKALPRELRDNEGNVRVNEATGEALTPKILLETKLGAPVVEFGISQKQLNDLMSMAGVLGLTDMRVKPRDGKVVVSMYQEMPNGIDSSTSEKSDFYEIEVGDWNGPDFSLDIEVSLLNIIPDDYLLLAGTDAGVIKFVSKTQELTYYIGTRETSYYGDR